MMDAKNINGTEETLPLLSAFVLMCYVTKTFLTFQQLLLVIFQAILILLFDGFIIQWSFAKILIVYDYFTGTGIECYTCGHEDDECNVDHYGEKVRCQMDDPENHNYGDSCYVGHSGTFFISVEF